MKKINLQDLEQGRINELVISLGECEADIDQVNQLLPIYDSCEPGILKDRYRNSISEILENIKSKDGFLVFLQMHKIEAFNNDNEEVIPEFLEVVNFINANIISALPWEVKAQFLYREEIENNFSINPLEDSKLVVQDPRDFKYVFSNNPIHQAVINIMSSPTGNIRAFELFNLYVQVLLIKELNVDYNLFSNDGSSFTPKDGSKVDFCLEIEKLFKEYYENIKKGLDPEYFKGPKINTDWKELVIGSNNLRIKMINLKENNINILRKFDSEKLDDLVLDIRNFLNTFEDLDELVWPKVKQLNSKEGGAGLLKRININGGMKTVGDHYSTRIKEIIENENNLKVNEIKKPKMAAVEMEERIEELFKVLGHQGDLIKWKNFLKEKTPQK